MVTVQSQDVIQIPFDDLSDITFLKFEEHLVITGSDDSRIVLQKYFFPQSEREHPILQLGTGGPS